MRNFLLGIAVSYLVVGVLSGVAMTRAIPAMNALGGLYVGVTWPVAMFCAATIQCNHLPSAGSPLANAFFTFKDTSEGGERG